jgi:hypothetical protein
VGSDRNDKGAAFHSNTAMCTGSPAPQRMSQRAMPFVRGEHSSPVLSACHAAIKKIE